MHFTSPQDRYVDKHATGQAHASRSTTKAKDVDKTSGEHRPSAKINVRTLIAIVYSSAKVAPEDE